MIRARRGDREARTRLVEEHMRLVRSVAWRYRDMGLPVEDLVQEGAVGLLEAIARFDPANGSSFSSYAYWRVRKSITRALTEHGRLLRLPKRVLERRRALAHAAVPLVNAGRAPTATALAEATNLSPAEVVEALAAPLTVRSLDEPLPDGTPLEAVVADAAATDPAEAALDDAQTSALEAALARLSARQRAVIDGHFGLHGDAHTLAEMGNVLNVSPARARAIERDALHCLVLDLEETLADR